MFIDQVFTWLNQYFLPNWYWILPLGALFEGLFLLSLGAPGLVAIALAGYYAGIGEIPLIPVIILSLLGTITGDFTSYWLGRTYFYRFFFKKRVSSESKFSASNLLRRTIWFVPLYHFSSYGRALASAAYGSIRTPFHKWAVLDIMGAIIWCATFITISYFAGVNAKAVESILGLPNAVEWIFTGIFIAWLVSFVFAVWKIIRNKGV